VIGDGACEISCGGEGLFTVQLRLPLSALNSVSDFQHLIWPKSKMGGLGGTKKYLLLLSFGGKLSKSESVHKPSVIERHMEAGGPRCIKLDDALEVPVQFSHATRNLYFGGANPMEFGSQASRQLYLET